MEPDSTRSAYFKKLFWAEPPLRNDMPVTVKVLIFVSMEVVDCASSPVLRRSDKAKVLLGKVDANSH
jgi:hypothetical protein